MSTVKSLAKDTLIYGLSSIVGRFLNWCLVPLYTHIFPDAEYGIVTYVYAAVAILMILLTYGLETGFFRFANHERWSDPMQVYTTGLISLLTSSTAFVVVAMLFLTQLASWAGCAAHPSFIAMMVVCTGIDAFSALPFCYLRYRQRAKRYAMLKVVNICINIGLNLFFLLLCPWLMEHNAALVDWFYIPDFGVGYIFLSNLIATCVTLLMLTPQLRGLRWTFCASLWSEMIAYSFPLLIMGIAGIMNQNLPQLMLKWLLPADVAMGEVGIYGANLKIGIIMVMVLQAFRFAYEPFIFAQNKEKGVAANDSYAIVMKYFMVLTLFIFMGVMFYLDIVKMLIGQKYWAGLTIVPIVMVAEMMFGIFFNLSIWYKIKDQTHWGTWLSLIGLVITVVLNLVLVPRMGYMGCAWSSLACYGTMMLVSYAVGQWKYPIAYPLGSIGLYVALAAVLYVIGEYVAVTPNMYANWGIRAVLLAVYLAVVVKREGLRPASIVKPIMSKLRR